MSNENKRRGNVRSLEESVEFADDLLGIARRWTRITPAKSCAIIAHGAGGFCDLRLDALPAEHGRHQARLQDHSRAATTHGQQVQTMALQVEHLPRSRMPPAIPSRRHLLVNPSGQTR